MNFSLNHPSFFKCGDCPDEYDCETCPKPLLSLEEEKAVFFHNLIKFSDSLPNFGGLSNQPKALMERIMIVEHSIKEYYAKKDEEQAKKLKTDEMKSRRFGRR